MTIKSLIGIILIFIAGCTGKTLEYLGDPYTSDMLLDDMEIRFAGGTTDQRYVELNDDVIKFHVSDPFRHGSLNVLGGRIQAVYHNKSQDYRQKVSLKIPMDTLRYYKDNFSFLMIWEYWNGSFGSDYPFRINLSLHKPDTGKSDLHWLVLAQQWNDGFEAVWRQTSEQCIEFNKWIKLEIIVESGHFKFLVNNDVIFNIFSQTHHSSGPQQIHVHPMKIYTFKELIEYHPITLYWKDLTIF